MAKRKASKAKAGKRQKPPAATAPEPSVQTQFPLRMDAELYNKLKEIAEGCGTSVNQLLQGICRAIAENAHFGSPKIDGGRCVDIDDRRGCVFFGNLVTMYRSGSKRKRFSELLPSYDDDSSELRLAIHQGEIETDGVDGVAWFGLDFSGSPVRTY